MAAVTLTTLRSRVRERADMVNSTFLQDTATSLDALINEAVQELHELLTQHYGENYKMSQSSVSTVAGQSSYALPTDFYKLLGVDLTIASDQPRDLKRYTFKERNVMRASAQWGGLVMPQYNLEDSNIVLYPTPSGVYPLVLYYVPMLPLLVDPSDTVNFPNGYERYVVLSAAVKALKKEESDTRDLERELGTLEAKIITGAESRDAGAPKQAVDQEAVDNSAYWGGFIP